MVQNIKMLILDKILQFLLKNINLHKILKIYTYIETYVFLSRPSMEKEKKKKKNHQH